MLKILLASSSKAFLTKNENLLKREDIQIFTTTSGQEAIQLHSRHNFNLILSELILTDMGGDALCTTFRSAESTKKVAFVLVCYDNPEEHAKVRQCGADARIIRPVKPAQLIETVSSLLEMQIGRVKRALFTVNVSSKKDTVEFSCISINISITGILLETDHTLAIGDRIICRFTLPESIQIEAEGDVVRSISAMGNQHKYGVQFVRLPLSYRREIERYVATVEADNSTGN